VPTELPLTGSERYITGSAFASQSTSSSLMRRQIAPRTRKRGSCRRQLQQAIRSASDTRQATKPIWAAALFPQIPTGWDDAFSDQFFDLSNNHGRVFGPHQRPGSYVLIGAFSTENIAPFRWPGHGYDSFNKARDNFARRVSRASVFQLIGSVDLENAIVADPEVSTGDHDGTAALLWAK
jgi:hypothetical protein